MKYTIEGFSQEEAVKFKKLVPSDKGNLKEIRIDCTDLLILRWFVDFYPKMVKIEINGLQYAWLSCEKILEDLPLLGIKKQALIDRLHKLCEFDILRHITVKEQGNFSYYSFGSNYNCLIDTNEKYYADEDVYSTTEGMYSTTQPLCSQLHNPYVVNYATNNKSISNNSISNINKESKKKEKIDYKAIRQMYNEICVSYPKLTVLSDKRKQAINARMSTYSVNQFRKMFEMAESSSFLKGANNRNWKANFDWLIKDANFAKVLDGNYADKINAGKADSYSPRYETINGKRYEVKNGQYFIPGGCGIAVNPFANSDGWDFLES